MGRCKRKAKAGPQLCSRRARKQAHRLLIRVHIVEDSDEVIPVLWAWIRHVLAAHAGGKRKFRKRPMRDVGHSTDARAEVRSPPVRWRITCLASLQLAPDSSGCDLSGGSAPRQTCKEGGQERCVRNRKLPFRALSYFTSIPSEYFHSPKFLKPYPHSFRVATKCSVICGALCDILLSSTHSAALLSRYHCPYLPTNRGNLDAQRLEEMHICA
jgi:hypothetical protein